MATGDISKIVASIERVRFYKNEWGILECSVEKVRDKSIKPVTNKFNRICVKGTMFEPVEGNSYNMTIKEVDDPKWGKQYELVSIGELINIDTTDREGQKKFLLSLFTEGQVRSMYEALSDPFKAFSENNTASLVQIKGCGVNTALKWQERFNNKLPLAKMYIELEEYNLTSNMLKRLFDQYKSAELAIQKVKENPYSLQEVGGIGFTTADKIAMSSGIEQYSPIRISAYILFYLDGQAQNGYSIVSSDELMDGIVEVIGEDVPDTSIATAIHDMGEKIWTNEDHSKIGLMKYYNLEMSIAKELIRIRDAKSDFCYDGWEDIVKQAEKDQGWEYTDEQWTGIKTVLENNIVAITAPAGAGKTTIANGMLKVLHGYSSASTALSGKAAARIAEVTGEEGYTIHRLLGYPSREGKNGFTYHDENRLPYDIIILDEASMVGGYLFNNLLKAIKDGAKLIILFDIKQLASIGECNVAYDILNSPEIPTVELTKIHRQAQASGIISESFKIRSGIQLIEKDWAGTETRGQLQDLTLDCYSDMSNTFYKTMQHFAKGLEEVGNVLDIQVLCPIKNRGNACTWELNNAIQELYNPSDSKKSELTVYYEKGKAGILREGDKVINKKNNYKTVEAETGATLPIFNGNIGIIRKINQQDNTMLIDFQNIGSVIVDKDSWKSIELGYAISVHASQGSQWNRVILSIDYSAYALLTRELVYTAITRAQKYCAVVAQNSALRYAISQEGVNVKETHLQNCLYEIAHPKLIF